MTRTKRCLMTVVELNRWVQQEWMDEAACKGQTSWFFAPHGEQARLVAEQHREPRAHRRLGIDDGDAGHGSRRSQSVFNRT